MNAPSDVVIVGSGPNGLAAAVIAAAAGLSVRVLESEPTPGGGCRTEELDLGVPLLHDLCSAVHPMAVASPFFERFNLAARGVALLRPPISFAQPLLDGRAAVAYQDLDRTVGELAEDGAREGRTYRRVMAPLVEGWATVRDLGLSDFRSVPASLLRVPGVAGAAALAGRAVELGTPLWDWLSRAPRAGSLLTGVAAHANVVIPAPAGGATALLLGTLAHSHGWPIPVGGSQSITNALLMDLAGRGVEVVTDCQITDAAQLPRARAYLFDTSPWTLSRVFGTQLPERYRAALARFAPGNGVAKVDFALSGPVPWTDRRLAEAGTLHIGGSREEMKQAERDTAAGRHSSTPMTLASQPTVVDPTRSGPGGARPLWTYAHVPNSSTLDMTDAVTAHIERFAPGFRDVVIGSRCIPAAAMAGHNPNYVGGDIAVGTVSMYRMLARPVPRWNPYRTPLDTVYLCSASTPPGPGVHGMCGMHAAARVLHEQFGIRQLPDIGPADFAGAPRS
ncbi:phytoene desaturase family protein [Mycolicibacterium vinylchloridicum]|uniref:phytoene desaturase family protein n=1 Tax=Mycolicibacterium vinylchloridicum TaxID=2736928 RepID=UPI0015C97BE3|nr:NAD(P)/FAD-dependent oxidoreductase [Mycolicibacterium vinylchloridicum]